MTEDKEEIKFIRLIKKFKKIRFENDSVENDSVALAAKIFILLGDGVCERGYHVELTSIERDIRDICYEVIQNHLRSNKA